MDSRKLQYFEKIVELGSMTRASAEIGISQPALTRAIHILEEEVGVPLLDRTARGITPTRFGEMLYGRARAITTELTRAADELQAAKKLWELSIRIGTVPPLLPDILPSALLALKSKYPDNSVEVVIGTTEQLLLKLRRHEIDLAFVQQGQIPSDDNLECNILYNDKYCVVASVNHPLARLKEVPPKALIEYPWVFPHRGRQPFWDDVFSGLGIVLTKPFVETEELVLMIELVVQGDILFYTSRRSVLRELETGKIVLLPVVGLNANSTVAAVRLGREALSAPCAYLIKAVRKASMGEPGA